MNIKIAVISDLHLADSPRLPHLRGDIADILLLKAIHYINRLISPDLTLILGDLLDDPASPAAGRNLQYCRETLDLLKGPYVVIPGNHDTPAEDFYKILPRPAESFRLKGFEFHTFLDSEQPDFNARRNETDLARLAAAGNRTGPVICLQHVPVFPPGKTDCPYNLTNAEQVIDAMHTGGAILAISGHYHEGFALTTGPAPHFIAAPALCKSPFKILQLDVTCAEVKTTTHTLALAPELNLIDTHIHTQLAYCSENMDAARTIALAQDLNLAGICFCEHTAQLYFDIAEYENRRWLTEGLASASPQNSRISSYFDLLDSVGCPPASAALETDCDYAGNPILTDADRRRAAFLAGAIHDLAETRKPHPDYHRAREEYLTRLKKLLEKDITVLAHPFRVFSRANLIPDRSLFEPVVQMLRNTNTAAELNFHTQKPPAEFVRLCIAAGVKLTLGSDSHNLYEVGFLAPHLKLLNDLGAASALDEILLDPRPQTNRIAH